MLVETINELTMDFNTDNFGTIINRERTYNTEDFNNYGTITILGEFTNTASGNIFNEGTFINESGFINIGYLENIALFINRESVDNQGEIEMNSNSNSSFEHEFGYVFNEGLLSIRGTYNNLSSSGIENAFSGDITIYFGSLINNGPIVNNGYIITGSTGYINNLDNITNNNLLDYILRSSW